MPPLFYLHTINTERQHLAPNPLTNSPSTFPHYSIAATINSPVCQAHSLNQTPSLTRTRLLQRMPPTTKLLPLRVASVRHKRVTSEPNVSISRPLRPKLANSVMGYLGGPASEAPRRFECGACRPGDGKFILAKAEEGGACLDQALRLCLSLHSE